MSKKRSKTKAAAVFEQQKTRKKQTAAKKTADKENQSKSLQSILTAYPYLWIILIGGLLYFQVTGFDYVGLDDQPIITKNFETVGDLSKWSEAFERDAFLRDKGSFYRPMQTVSFMIDAQIGGKEPYIYHIVNLIIHLLTACAVYRLLTDMKYPKNASLAVSLLFTVHPLLTHAVAWIPARNDLLITLFCILSLLFFIRYTRTGSLPDMILHLLTITLAFFTKETALVFPAVCLLYSALIQKNKILDKKHIILTVIWVILIIIYFSLRINAIGFDWGKNDFGVLVLLKNIQIIPEILTKLVVPYHLPVLATFSTAKTIIGTVILAGIIALAVRSKTARPVFLIFGAAWFLMMILPGTLYRHSYADYFYDYLDHRAYLPMIGLLLLIAELLPKKFFNFNKAATAAVIGAALLVYGGLAYNHSGNYKDRISFRGKAARDDPDKAGFRLAYGKALKEEGKIDEAEQEFLEGIRQMPQEQDFYFQLGEIYFKKGQYDKTIKFLEKGIEIDPTNSESYNNLGGTYLSMGKRQEALRVWEKAFELDSTNLGAANELVKLYARMGMMEKALKTADAIKAQGETPAGLFDLYVARGYEQYKKGNLSEAIELTLKAVEINQTSEIAFNNLGVYHAAAGKYKEAAKYWQKAYSLNKANMEYARNIYGVYFNYLKDLPEAARWADVLLKNGAKIAPAELKKLKPYMR